jgi:hypothetical protein
VTNPSWYLSFGCLASREISSMSRSQFDHRRLGERQFFHSSWPLLLHLAQLGFSMTAATCVEMSLGLAWMLDTTSLCALVWAPFGCTISSLSPSQALIVPASSSHPEEGILGVRLRGVSNGLRRTLRGECKREHKHNLGATFL